MSLSPELFVSLTDGAARTKPMKGTRPRGADQASDLALAQELSGSVKDKAENLMIVDLMRNDLSRVAVAGSVRVDAPFAVESYPTVHQMVSSVRASSVVWASNTPRISSRGAGAMRKRRSVLSSSMHRRTAAASRP